jgi:anti-sigma B factor antagonist
MQVTHGPGAGLLRLDGRLDVRCVDAVRKALHLAIDEAAGSGADVRVDLSATEVGDATGLGVLVSAHRRAGRLGCRLVLLDVPPRLGRLLRATKLHRILVVAPGPVPTG